MPRGLAALLVLFASLALTQGTYAQALSGNIFIHDPSVILANGQFASFATGVEQAADGGMPRTKSSPDGVTWKETGPLPGGMPDWIVAELGFTPKNLWAPSVSEHDGTHYLYYSASTFGKNTSLIGLMTNDAFDAADAASGWQDQGMVVRSSTGDNFNAIDPFRIDTGDGRAWLAFGSWWDGIRMVEIDPVSGKRQNDSPPFRLASRGGGAIEAPAILHHNGYYYLFVSFDKCCRGTASTYRIMVGRAPEVTGPYLDGDGKPMLEGGGIELLASNGRYRGPGGQETFTGPNGEPWLAFHYYDRHAGGAPKLHIAPLRWSDDGWPALDPLPE